MLYRKIAEKIEDHLKSIDKPILLVTGARQVGKSYIIRYVCKKLYKNYIEINMLEDFISEQRFLNIRSIEDFYLQVSAKYGHLLDKKENTVIFIDEIQTYPQLLTLLKFLKQDDKYTYIASGSLLGVTLKQTTSIPIGSIKLLEMYPLDFEEFLFANGSNQNYINYLKEMFLSKKSLSDDEHNRLLTLFRKYLLVGGLPQVVQEYIDTKNIYKVRSLQTEIHFFYSVDASKYDDERKLKIKRIYDSIQSNMENKKKRVTIKDIEGKKGKTFSDYQDEFDYLISSGITLDVLAVSNPTFPLIQSESKNLLKLYFNDVGIFTNILYSTNIDAILNDQTSVNLGAVYENVIACELKAHGHKLYYYDNRNKGEVDYLIDDYNSLSTLPIEVKSGKDYYIHSALNNLLSSSEYHIKRGLVLSNSGKIFTDGKIEYYPIYFAMFL